MFGEWLVTRPFGDALERKDESRRPFCADWPQREGDDWSGVGQYETYRWWASFKSQTPLIAGNYEIIAPFDQKWTAVQTSDALTNNTAFNDALLHANRVGFTLGGGDGLGHGVYATGNAKIVVTEFVVE